MLHGDSDFVSVASACKFMLTCWIRIFRSGESIILMLSFHVWMLFSWCLLTTNTVFLLLLLFSHHFGLGSCVCVDVSTKLIFFINILYTFVFVRVPGPGRCSGRGVIDLSFYDHECIINFYCWSNKYLRLEKTNRWMVLISAAIVETSDLLNNNNSNKKSSENKWSKRFCFS